MEGGKEQNYWPGFVDALSNVVLTLVFVLVIFVFALVMASNKVEQRMQQVTQQEQTQKTQQTSQGPENLQLKLQLAAVTAELDKLKGQVRTVEEKKTGALDQNAMSAQNNEDKTIAIENTEQKKVGQGTVQVNHASNKVVLGFPLSVVEMDDKSANELGHVLDALQKTLGKHKVAIHSILGKETYSAAERMAYYRAIGARNYLIKAGETPSSITTSIVHPLQPEDGRVEIIFEKE